MTAGYLDIGFAGILLLSLVQVRYGVWVVAIKIACLLTIFILTNYLANSITDLEDAGMMLYMFTYFGTALGIWLLVYFFVFAPLISVIRPAPTLAHQAFAIPLTILYFFFVSLIFSMGLGPYGRERLHFDTTIMSGYVTPFSRTVAGYAGIFGLVVPSLDSYQIQEEVEF